MVWASAVRCNAAAQLPVFESWGCHLALLDWAAVRTSGSTGHNAEKPMVLGLGIPWPAISTISIPVKLNWAV